ncbi:hypothetical protein JCM5353_006968 [Sporobolomyces roseus]
MRLLVLYLSVALLFLLLDPVEAMKKKKIKKPRTFCPPNEVACPIIGSTTYQDALKQHLERNATVQGIMAGDGGYECINVQEALDSCGGCASTGEGRDCTKIRGAVGVTCAESRCKVSYCRPGWKVAMSGEACVRSKTRATEGAAAKSSTKDLKKLARKQAQRHGTHGSPLSS